MNTLPIPQHRSPFDQIRKVDEQGREYWSARELQTLMGYTEWRKFEDAIERAMIACKNSGQNPADHIGGAANMVQVGSGAMRRVKDYHLSRYACYLTAMNSDPRKAEVSQAQTYFAIKTREAELAPTQQVPAPPEINSLWQQRLLDFNRRTHIPAGYWSIFNMVAGYCFTDEFRGVHLIDEALPDGSIGRRWCDYLREQGYDMRLIKKYLHHYPDKRGDRPANIYPTEWLGLFWTWFHGTYLKVYYPDYLRNHALTLPASTGKRSLPSQKHMKVK